MQNPVVRCARRRCCAGFALAGIFDFRARAGGGIDPLGIVAVLFDSHCHRARLLHVNHVFDPFQLKAASVVDIEKRLQFPVSRGRHEFIPGFHGDARSFIRNHSRGILAIHRRIPQMMPECVGTAVGHAEIVDRRILIDLLFHTADCVVRSLAGTDLHPTVVDERRGGRERARGRNVLIRIELFEVSGDFSQQGAAIVVVFPRFNAVPNHIESRQSR